MRKVVYLGGAILNCTDPECKDWRNAAKAALSGAIDEAIDPMVRDYRGREDDCYVECVELDKVDIANSTILLVYYPKPSTGTAMEIILGWMTGKLIVVVADDPKQISPWLRYHSHFLTNNFQAAYDYIRKL